MSSADISVSLEIDEAEMKRIERGMKQLAQRDVMQIARKSANFATTPILQEAKRLVPVRYRQLKKSLGRKTKKYASSGTVVVVIGARAGFSMEVDGKKVNPAKYCHLVENGTKFAPAHPFLRPALESKAPEAVARFTSKAAQLVDQAVLKMKG